MQQGRRDAQEGTLSSTMLRLRQALRRTMRAVGHGVESSPPLPAARIASPRQPTSTPVACLTRAPELRTSLDHLVGRKQKLRRDRDAERLRGAEVDHQLEFARLLDRYLPRPNPAKHLGDERYEPTVQLDEVDAVGDQSAAGSKRAKGRETWNSASRDDSSNLAPRLLK